MRASIDRFMDKIIGCPMSGCWWWMGSRNNKGYGQFRFTGKTRLAHRAAFVMLVGPLDDDECLMHSCDNGMHGCVSPFHLSIGTVTQNNRDMHARGRGYARHRGQTHCRNGHAFDDANTWTTPDGKHRHCRKCAAVRQAQRRARGLS